MKERSKQRNAEQPVKKDVTTTVKENAEVGLARNAGACLKKQSRGSRKRKRTESSGCTETMEHSESKRTQVDRMEKWDGLDVPHSVLVGLCEMGFTEPTPIQIHALPPAIRDRRDVVGAAETVSKIIIN